MAGCARGLADNLRNLTIPTLHQLHDTYRQDAAVYVFDDDPLDRHRSMLRKWAHRRRHVRLILANEYTGSERIQRLVVCRNTLVHEARQVLAARGVFLMLDLDCRFPMLVGGEWHSKWLRLLHGVSNASSSFGVLVSSNPGAYRDMWALRSTRLGMAYDCFWDFEQMKSQGNCKNYRLHVHPSLSPFDIEAGFDGAAAYSAKALRQAAECQHRNESDGHIVSEHVPFQDCLRRHGVRVGLAPWFLTSCAGWQTKETGQAALSAPEWHTCAGGLFIPSRSIIRYSEPRARAQKDVGMSRFEPWGTRPSKARGWYPKL